MIKKMNSALDFLRDKYGASQGTITQNLNRFELCRPDGTVIHLLPHRVERRFVELKKIIDSKTLEDISTFRFAHFVSNGDLRKLLARELDLAVFLSGSKLISLFASGDGNNVCNVIFRLENGMSGCIECGTKLPPGSLSMDRHEIIAKRGVASDRAVDTQVPQDSIYLWSQERCGTFTDVDTELFGLSDEAIWNVRAAFALLSDQSLDVVWNKADERSLIDSDAAIKSAKTGKLATL